MFRIHSIDGVLYKGPLETLRYDEGIKSPEKSFSARKIFDGNGYEEKESGKEGADINYSHAVKAYRAAVKMNQMPEPLLHAYAIMKSPVQTIDPDKNIVDAWELFRSRDIRHMPVISEDNKIIGIVSLADLMKSMNVLSAKAEDLPGILVRDIMSKKVITADKMTDIRRIARAMFEHHIGTMPVVDDAGELIGIITRSDILYALINYPSLSLWI